MTRRLACGWVLLLITAVVLLGACGDSSRDRPAATGAFLRLDFVARDGTVQLDDVWRFDMPGGTPITERAGGSVQVSVRIGGTIRETHYLDFSSNGRLEGHDGTRRFGYPAGGAGLFDSVVVPAHDDMAVDLRLADASSVTIDAARLRRARSLDGALARSIPHVRLLHPGDIEADLAKMVSSDLAPSRLVEPEDAYFAAALTRELGKLTPKTRGALRTLGLLDVSGSPASRGVQALDYGSMVLVDASLPAGILAHGAAHALASAREAAPQWGSSFEGVWARLQGASGYGPYPEMGVGGGGIAKPDPEDFLEQGFADPYGSRTVVEDIATYAELEVGAPTTQRLCEAFRASPTLLPSLAPSYTKLRLLELEGYVTRAAVSECTKDPPVPPGAGIRAYRRNGAVEEFTTEPRVSRAAGNDEERITLQSMGPKGRAQISFARSLTGAPLTVVGDTDGLKVPDSSVTSGRIVFLESVKADAAKGFLVGSYFADAAAPLVTFDVQGPPVQPDVELPLTKVGPSDCKSNNGTLCKSETQSGFSTTCNPVTGGYWLSGIIKGPSIHQEFCFNYTRALYKLRNAEGSTTLVLQSALDQGSPPETSFVIEIEIDYPSRNPRGMRPVQGTTYEVGHEECALGTCATSANDVHTIDVRVIYTYEKTPYTATSGTAVFSYISGSPGGQMSVSGKATMWNGSATATLDFIGALESVDFF